jgi:hypothetical protein
MHVVLHDDPEREYAFGPAQGLPETSVGTFTQALYDEAKSRGLDSHQHERRLEGSLSRQHWSRHQVTPSPAGGVQAGHP